MMERAVECATHNLGRIRLVWGRLWGVLSAHLVSAACHPDARVASAAVDHMRLLAQTLLARAQLSGFSYQVCRVTSDFRTSISNPVSEQLKWIKNGN